MSYNAFSNISHFSKQVVLAPSKISVFDFKRYSLPTDAPLSDDRATNTIAFLRHGMTDKNTDNDELKWDKEPLSQKELQCLENVPNQEWSIAARAEEMKSLIGNQEFHIYFPVTILRDFQTAQIVCHVMGLEFPSADLEKLVGLYLSYDKSQNSEILDQIIQLQDKIPPYLHIEESLKTRAKWDVMQKRLKKRLFWSKSKDWEEANFDSINRAGGPIERCMDDVAENKVSWKFNLFIGHRTGMEAFSVLSKEKDCADAYPKSNPGDLKIATLNKQWEAMRGDHKTRLLLDHQNYQQNIAQFSEFIEGLDVKKWLLYNQNAINSFLQNLSVFFDLWDSSFVVKPNNLHAILLWDKSFLSHEAFFQIIENYAKFNTSTLDPILKQYLKKKLESNLDDKEIKALFDGFWSVRGESELWKWVLWKVMEKNKDFVAKNKDKYGEDFANTGQQMQSLMSFGYVNGNRGMNYEVLENGDVMGLFEEGLVREIGRISQDGSTDNLQDKVAQIYEKLVVLKKLKIWNRYNTQPLFDINFRNWLLSKLSDQGLLSKVEVLLPVLNYMVKNDWRKHDGVKALALDSNFSFSDEQYKGYFTHIFMNLKVDPTKCVLADKFRDVLNYVPPNTSENAPKYTNNVKEQTMKDSLVVLMKLFFAQNNIAYNSILSSDHLSQLQKKFFPNEDLEKTDLESVKSFFMESTLPKRCWAGFVHANTLGNFLQIKEPLQN